MCVSHVCVVPAGRVPLQALLAADAASAPHTSSICDVHAALFS